MRDKLFELGHSVVSTWLGEQIKAAGLSIGAFSQKMAMKDMQEIASADCLILDRATPSMSGGKMIEYGFALAHHKLLYVVDPLAKTPGGCIFLRLADKCFDSWDELLVYFKEYHND